MHCRHPFDRPHYVQQTREELDTLRTMKSLNSDLRYDCQLGIASLFSTCIGKPKWKAEMDLLSNP